MLRALKALAVLAALCLTGWAQVNNTASPTETLNPNLVTKDSVATVDGRNSTVNLTTTATVTATKGTSNAQAPTFSSHPDLATNATVAVVYTAAGAINNSTTPTETLHPNLVTSDLATVVKNPPKNVVVNLTETSTLYVYMCASLSTGALVENLTTSASASTGQAHNYPVNPTENLNLTTQVCGTLNFNMNAENLLTNPNVSAQKNAGQQNFSIQVQFVGSTTDSPIQSSANHPENPSATLVTSAQVGRLEVLARAPQPESLTTADSLSRIASMSVGLSFTSTASITDFVVRQANMSVLPSALAVNLNTIDATSVSSVSQPAVNISENLPALIATASRTAALNFTLPPEGLSTIGQVGIQQGISRVPTETLSTVASLSFGKNLSGLLTENLPTVGQVQVGKALIAKITESYPTADGISAFNPKTNPQLIIIIGELRAPLVN